MKSRFTSIVHIERANYQADYFGTEHDCLAQFEAWCIKNGGLWGHMFDERTGKHIATYNAIQGLRMI